MLIADLLLAGAMMFSRKITYVLLENGFPADLLNKDPEYMQTIGAYTGAGLFFLMFIPFAWFVALPRYKKQRELKRINTVKDVKKKKKEKEGAYKSQGGKKNEKASFKAVSGSGVGKQVHPDPSVVDISEDDEDVVFIRSRSLPSGDSGILGEKWSAGEDELHLNSDSFNKNPQLYAGMGEENHSEIKLSAAAGSSMHGNNPQERPGMSFSNTFADNSGGMHGAGIVKDYNEDPKYKSSIENAADTESLEMSGFAGVKVSDLLTALDKGATDQLKTLNKTHNDEDTNISASFAEMFDNAVTLQSEEGNGYGRRDEFNHESAYVNRYTEAESDELTVDDIKEETPYLQQGFGYPDANTAESYAEELTSKGERQDFAEPSEVRESADDPEKREYIFATYDSADGSIRDTESPEEERDLQQISSLQSEQSYNSAFEPVEQAAEQLNNTVRERDNFSEQQSYVPVFENEPAATQAENKAFEAESEIVETTEQEQHPEIPESESAHASSAEESSFNTEPGRVETSEQKQHPAAPEFECAAAPVHAEEQIGETVTEIVDNLEKPVVTAANNVSDIAEPADSRVNDNVAQSEESALRQSAASAFVPEHGSAERMSELCEAAPAAETIDKESKNAPLTLQHVGGNNDGAHALTDLDYTETDYSFSFNSTVIPKRKLDPWCFAEQSSYTGKTSYKANINELSLSSVMGNNSNDALSEELSEAINRSSMDPDGCVSERSDMVSAELQNSDSLSQNSEAVSDKAESGRLISEDKSAVLTEDQRPDTADLSAFAAEPVKITEYTSSPTEEIVSEHSKDDVSEFKGEEKPVSKINNAEPVLAAEHEVSAKTENLRNAADSVSTESRDGGDALMAKPNDNTVHKDHLLHEICLPDGKDCVVSNTVKDSEYDVLALPAEEVPSFDITQEKAAAENAANRTKFRKLNRSQLDHSLHVLRNTASEDADRQRRAELTRRKREAALTKDSRLNAEFMERRIRVEQENAKVREMRLAAETAKQSGVKSDSSNVRSLLTADSEHKEASVVAAENNVAAVINPVAEEHKQNTAPEELLPKQKVTLRRASRSAVKIAESVPVVNTDSVNSDLKSPHSLKRRISRNVTTSHSIADNVAKQEAVVTAATSQSADVQNANTENTSPVAVRSSLKRRSTQSAADESRNKEANAKAESKKPAQSVTENKSESAVKQHKEKTVAVPAKAASAAKAENTAPVAAKEQVTASEKPKASQKAGALKRVAEKSTDTEKTAALRKTTAKHTAVQNTKVADKSLQADAAEPVKRMVRKASANKGADTASYSIAARGAVLKKQTEGALSDTAHSVPDKAAGHTVSGVRSVAGSGVSLSAAVAAKAAVTAAVRSRAGAVASAISPVRSAAPVRKPAATPADIQIHHPLRHDMRATASAAAAVKANVSAALRNRAAHSSGVRAAAPAAGNRTTIRTHSRAESDRVITEDVRAALKAAVNSKSATADKQAAHSTGASDAAKEYPGR